MIEVVPEAFTLMLVAYKQAHVALPRRPLGSRVNIEGDILAKYVERLVGKG